eukprot:4125130-Alexandrium_andersonii.AAC.1
MAACMRASARVRMHVRACVRAGVAIVAVLFPAPPPGVGSDPQLRMDQSDQLIRFGVAFCASDT